MASQRKDESLENTCVVCFKEVEIFSIGQCDHPVCFECSTRMRVLCRQNECPICRQDMPTVIFTRAISPFESINAGNFVSDSKYKIFFSSDDEKLAYENLLIHICPQCGKISPNFGHLRDHVRRVHMLIYCDLCVDHLKILTRERRCYNRKDLATHRKVGDPDDRSHRGHPLCEFCDKRYMDNDELFKHLRRDHFYCHFCDADGLHYYYKTYDSLREHFRSDHYLCEEGDCYMEKFTSVFRTDIDLKAHKASAHGKVLGKAALKQARTLDIAFTLAPRPRPQRPNRHHNSQPPQQSGTSFTSPREEDKETGASGGAKDEPPPEVEKPPQQPVAQLNTSCIEEFPTLRGGVVPPPPSITSGGNRKTASASLRSQGQFTAEDFPALGPETPAAPVTTSVTMRVNTERPSSSSNTPQQTNLSIQVSSPRFTTTVTSKKTYNLHFPALDENREPPVVGSSATVQWTAKKKPQKESQTPLFQPSTVANHISKSKPIPKMDDFPALEPKSSNKPLFPKTAPKISTASTVPTKMTSIEDQFAQTKSKKKKSKSKSTTSGGTNNGDNKKKSSAETGSGEPAYEPKKTNAAYEKRAQLFDGMVETEPNEVRPTPQSLNLMSEDELIMLMRGNLNEKENRRETANKPLRIDEGSFPALPGFGPPPGFEVKWEAKNSVRKTKMPPPGLAAPSHSTTKNQDKSRGPPPGLDVNFSSAPPPGFSPVNGSFPPLPNDTAYISPPSFDRRNTSLVDKIAKALGTDALNDFKQISFAFRSSMLGAPEYYNYCKDSMGDDSFVGIFPELLALLPEIGKQQELWPHYKTDKDRFEASTTKGNRLDACATCSQVLRYGDLKDHLSRHSLDNHFPSLEQKKQSPKSSWSK